MTKVALINSCRDYLAFAESRERLVVSDSPLATRTRLLADWWSVARDDLAGNVMIALRRRDVAELNALARGLMETHGRLGRQRLQIAGREFAAGDRLVCLRNSDVLGVKNGTRGTVEAIDRERRALIVLTDRGDRVTLNRRYLESGDVRHAYALTGHASQGITVEQAFVLGTGEARLQEWGYVALSRARDATRVYVTGTIRDRESHAADLDDRDPVTRFARALEESAIELLAVDQRPLPSGPRHSTRAEIERPDPSQERRSRLRRLEQQGIVLRKTRDDVERKLREAEQDRSRLGLVGRGRRREELGSKIAVQKTTLEMIDRELRELDRRAAEERRVPMEHGRPPFALQDHNLARTGPEQERGFGLDL